MNTLIRFIRYSRKVFANEAVKQHRAGVITRVLMLVALSFALPVHAYYAQINLVSDGSVANTVTDPNLINPWGIAASPSGPLWVSDNGTGVTTLYNGSGNIVPLVVTIPPPAGGNGPAKPTGQIFNGSSNFNSDVFIFATEDGTLSGWRGALGTSAELLVDNSGSGANYKGLAIGSNLSGTNLYAANFAAGRIDVFNSSLSPTLLGTFIDPNLPAGYAPFNIQNISGRLYVTYALQDANKQDEVAGSGNGYLDVFDTDGNLIKRLVSNGPLNAPWGLAMAPFDFGAFSNDLLVGNFGDGLINAFDPLTGNLLGALDDSNNIPLAIDGLWALSFGNGGSGGKTDELFFTAGPNDETNGLFGKITAHSVPEPATYGLFGIGIAALMLSRSRVLRQSNSTAVKSH